jgi:SAM-dependent methyltransferase
MPILKEYIKMAKHSNLRIANHIVYKLGNQFRNKYLSKVKGHLCDLGCGDMYYQQYYSHMYESYTGVDWIEDPNRVDYITSDLNKRIELPDQSCDTIISFSVMEHLHTPDVFLAEIHRVLRIDGHLLLQVPFAWHLHEEPHDYFRYTRYALEKMLTKSGFDEFIIETQSGPATVVAVKGSYLVERILKKIPIIGVLLVLLSSIALVPLQYLALWTDMLSKSKYDTIGYFVIAKKNKAE